MSIQLRGISMSERKLSPEEVGNIAASIIEETKPYVDTSVQITRDEYGARWKKLQEVMIGKGYGLAYACGSEIDRSDIAWLAGVFDPIIERYGILIPAEGKPAVLAGSEGGHVIEEAVERSGADLFLLEEFQISDEDYRHAHFVGVDDVLSSIGYKGDGKVAILSSAQFIPYDHMVLLQGKFGSDNVVFDPELLQLIKYEKSDRELQICKIANRIADAAMRGMLAVTVPGMTELEVAGVGDFIMKELGAGRTGFPTIVTAGERGYTVIGPATNNVLREGDIVSVGVSPTFNGYHGIVRRTVKVGDEALTEGQRSFMKAVEGLYRVVMEATIDAAKRDLPSNYIDQQGKLYLENVNLKSLNGTIVDPMEPYTFMHNTGCSECQEGYGAVTPYTENRLGNQVTLMVDVALVGFKKRGEPIFDILYAVVEDAFWKSGSKVGIYNKFPLNVQHLVGNTDPIGDNVNPYFKEP